MADSLREYGDGDGDIVIDADMDIDDDFYAEDLTILPGVTVTVAQNSVVSGAAITLFCRGLLWNRGTIKCHQTAGSPGTVGGSPTGNPARFIVPPTAAESGGQAGEVGNVAGQGELSSADQSPIHTPYVMFATAGRFSTLARGVPGSSSGGALSGAGAVGGGKLSLFCAHVDNTNGLIDLNGEDGGDASSSASPPAWVGSHTYAQGDVIQSGGIGFVVSNSGAGSSRPGNRTLTVVATTIPSGGTWTLTILGQTASSLAWNISTSSLKTAIEALSSVGSGNVASVTGTNIRSDTGGYTIVIAASVVFHAADVSSSMSGLTPDGSGTAVIGVTNGEPDWSTTVAATTIDNAIHWASIGPVGLAGGGGGGRGGIALIFTRGWVGPLPEVSGGTAGSGYGGGGDGVDGADGVVQMLIDQ